MTLLTTKDVAVELRAGGAQREKLLHVYRWCLEHCPRVPPPNSREGDPEPEHGYCVAPRAQSMNSNAAGGAGAPIYEACTGFGTDRPVITTWTLKP
jgi:hypothetical protein